jgi:peptidase M28-like protein
MKNTLLIALLFATSACAGQPPAIKKIAQQASKENLKSNLYYLAGDKLAGRLMGSAGDSLASLFIADWFSKNGLAAPYQNGKSYIQQIAVKRIDDKNSLRINDSSYPASTGWSLFSEESFNFQETPVILADFATISEWSKNLPLMNVSNSAIIINTNLFSDTKALDSLEQVLAKKGARLIIYSGPRTSTSLQRLKDQEFLPKYELPSVFKAPVPIPQLLVSSSLLQTLLVADSITLNSDGSYTKPADHAFIQLKGKIHVQHQRELIDEVAPNVIGTIKGTDPDAGCVIISAHHDHDGKNGDVIYKGAVDNASGTVAIMEVAALMNKAVKNGLRPKRSIVFASYTGEERGLLGSFYFAANPLFPIAKTHAVLNIDMLGRVDTIHSNHNSPDTNYAYILVKDPTNRGLRNSLYQANESVKLVLDKHYEQPQFETRRIYGSDQFPFYEKGVPFVRIDCGFTMDYHKPGDTPDKINYDLLTTQTKLVFLTMWNLANN